MDLASPIEYIMTTAATNKKLPMKKIAICIVIIYSIAKCDLNLNLTYLGNGYNLFRIDRYNSFIYNRKTNKIITPNTIFKYIIKDNTITGIILEEERFDCKKENESRLEYLRRYKEKPYFFTFNIKTESYITTDKRHEISKTTGATLTIKEQEETFSISQDEIRLLKQKNNYFEKIQSKLQSQQYKCKKDSTPLNIANYITQ